MSDNITVKKYSFKEFLNTHKAEIPIIQRDYAQGRASKAKIRNKFLSKLFEHLESGERLELDFIYGTENNHIVQILDGQQRLTTLFLLHWYIANKANEVEELENLFLEEGKVKFTYHTRTSSREFCQNLIEKGIDFKNLIPDEKEPISKTIIDSNWFYLFWKKDPSIKGMLNMLDAIHNKFGSEITIKAKSYWENLDRIKFHYLPLKDFDLTDTLYIKMNARGKKLTDFENFKAEFESYIKKERFEDSKKIKEEFSHKIDTDWSNLFWKFRDENNTIDSQLMQFMAGVAINNYADKKLIAREIGKQYSSKNLKENELIEKRIKFLADNPQELAPQDFPNKDYFNYLNDCFNAYLQIQNCLSKKRDSIDRRLKLWNYYHSPRTIFAEFINTKKPTYKQRSLFYALTCYLKKHETEGKQVFEKQSLKDWLRVIRNIIENSTVDSSTNFISSIQLIKELSEGCNSIYDHLNKKETQSDFEKVHTKDQIKEEQQKANLILTSKEWREAIFEMEDHDFFRGQIGFAIMYANEDLEKFKDYSYKLQELFKENFKEKPNFLFQRALLATGYYLQSKRRTKTFCAFSDRKSWRKVFKEKRDNKDFILKELLDNIGKESIKEGLEKIIEKFLNNEELPETDWRKIIIKNPEIIKFCERRLIMFQNEDDNCPVYLLSKSTRGSYHKELRTWYLYQKLFKDKQLENIKKHKYSSSKSTTRPGIKMTLKNNREIKVVKSFEGVGFDIKFSKSTPIYKNIKEQELMKKLAEMANNN